MSETWKRCRKRPVVVQFRDARPGEGILTMEGALTAKAGDVIILGVEGEVYPCDRSVFEKTYDVLDEVREGADREALWDAIHDYVRACGGDPGQHVHGNIARQDAVVRVEAEATRFGTP